MKHFAKYLLFFAVVVLFARLAYTEPFVPDSRLTYSKCDTHNRENLSLNKFLCYLYATILHPYAWIIALSMVLISVAVGYYNGTYK